MKKILYSAAMVLVMASAPVFASQCPVDMGKIDAALAKNPQMSSADMAKVKELRAKGEQQHKAGQHSDSVATLAEAKKMLGI